jgi:hypothetical protein
MTIDETADAALQHEGKLSETMRTRASAVTKHREDHPENGAPEVSPEVKTAMQEAAAKIRALIRR